MSGMLLIHSPLKSLYNGSELGQDSNIYIYVQISLLYPSNHTNLLLTAPIILNMILKLTSTEDTIQYYMIEHK